MQYWKLLSTEKKALGGKVAVHAKKDWHVILVNTKENDDASINLRYGKAASLAASLMTTAMLFLVAN